MCTLPCSLISNITPGVHRQTGPGGCWKLVQDFSSLGNTWPIDTDGPERKEMLGCISIPARDTEGFLNKYPASYNPKERRAQLLKLEE